ncbi:hypothetical protein C8F04DRAFT_1391570 [Mycena alexandri]|uniref:Uncharacterized protein n=1 Tax=Mycena alexandri TaxID=1745969 RepID=A0AAD6X9V4_9AGAR|nr:hypothetical protein C8F04DRAFT_1391570 [Mycena alexandri]
MSKASRYRDHSLSGNDHHSNEIADLSRYLTNVRALDMTFGIVPAVHADAFFHSEFMASFPNSPSPATWKCDPAAGTAYLATQCECDSPDLSLADHLKPPSPHRSAHPPCSQTARPSDVRAALQQLTTVRYLDIAFKTSLLRASAPQTVHPEEAWASIDPSHFFEAPFSASEFEWLSLSLSLSLYKDFNWAELDMFLSGSRFPYLRMVAFANSDESHQVTFSLLEVLSLLLPVYFPREVYSCLILTHEINCPEMLGDVIIMGAGLFRSPSS